MMATRVRCRQELELRLMTPCLSEPAYRCQSCEVLLDLECRLMAAQPQLIRRDDEETTKGHRANDAGLQCECD